VFFKQLDAEKFSMSERYVVDIYAVALMLQIAIYSPSTAEHLCSNAVQQSRFNISRIYLGDLA